MILSINPTYYCNFRCHFCYLTSEQLSNRKLLDLETLESRLIEVLNNTTIDHVDLYGGEIGLLPEDYVWDLKDLLYKYDIKSISVNTNLSMVNNIICDPDFHISVSYDFDVREQHERVWNNMIKLNRPFSVLILASDKIIQHNVDNMIFQLNLLSKLQSVEIKPYSENQANCLTVSFKDYEEFVKKWIISTTPKRFEFINEYLLEDVLNKKRNSFSDDHLYITPEGKFAVLEFDLNDREYFLHCETYKDYLKWCEKEKKRVSKNTFCSKCEYFSNCLSEHLREVKNLDNGCNGFKYLIDWYKNGRLENQTRSLS